MVTYPEYRYIVIVQSRTEEEMLVERAFDTVEEAHDWGSEFVDKYDVKILVHKHIVTETLVAEGKKEDKKTHST